MAINIKFDLSGNPEPPTIILAKRNGERLGQLEVEAKSIDLNDMLNDASEFSFTLHKYVDDRITNLWDEVVNFKLVYCKEWDMYFEIAVEVDEETETVKTVTCTQLGQAELSQITLYNMHINEEGDINWNKDNKEYKSTILYSPDDTSISLLHRILKDKAPHYTIRHVDDTIKNIQRTFSFDGTSIYDAFMEIAEKIGCLFVFHSDSDENGNINRDFSVYDLQQNCMNVDCSHRGEFIDECPKCGSKNIKYGYGKDTTIFVTADELAANGIQLTTDTDSVKNCFKLEAGDDLMTATIVNCNPNGTPYIWYFSDEVKSDMSKELVEKINEYDKEYEYYYNNREFTLNVTSYNELAEKYIPIYNAKSSTCLVCNNKGDFDSVCPECGSTNIYMKNKLKTISTPIKGYSSLTNIYYDVIDLGLYLESGLMPNVDIGSKSTNAEEQASLLTSATLSPVAVTDLKIASKATVDTSILSMAKIHIKNTYKVDILKDSSELSDYVDGDNTRTWEGKFVVTNYSDDTDTYTTGVVSVTINDDLETVTKQKLDKVLSKEESDNYSITGLFKMEHNDFCNELKYYALVPLKGFHDACQACIDILIEQEAGNPSINKDLYEKLYLPYYNKLKAIESEIAVREREVNSIKGVYDSNGKLTTEGFQHEIEKLKDNVKSALDFETYLGKDLWIEFCSYRREDKYENSSYISDGLNNAEMFKKASEFIETAKDEIYKSAELQHSISTSLKNLLAIPKFKPLVEHFNLGNWIRVKIDDQIFKLRLLEYSISFGSFDEIPVVFSEVTKVKNGITDVQSILSQASSMATSYSSVQKQASQGEEVKGTIDQWLTSGLNSAAVQIQNNDSEEITFTKNGLLCRSYDDMTDSYMPEQLKLTHNIIAYTDDDWKTVRQAIGKHNYIAYNKGSDSWGTNTGYGMSADFVTAGQVSGSKIVGGEIYSERYSSRTPAGTYINLNTGDFEIGGKKLIYDAAKDKLLLNGVTIEWSNANKPDVEIKDITGLESYLNELDELEDKVDKAKSVADNAASIGSALVNGLGFKETEITGNYVISPVISGGTLLIGDEDGTYAQITTDGKLKATGAEITGKISGSTIYGGSIEIGNNFSVDKDGILNAANGKFTGEISSNIGNIGNWKIDDGNISCFNEDNNTGIILDANETVISLYNTELNDENNRVYISSQGIGLYASYDDEGMPSYQSIEFCMDNKSCYWLDVNGITTSNGAIFNCKKNGFEVENGYLYLNDDRIYLSNNRGIRGMKLAEDGISIDGSNVIGYVHTNDRVVLGDDNNSAATEMRSPTSVYLKCGGTMSDDSRYTLQWARLNVGTSDSPKYRGVLRPTYDAENGSVSAWSNLGSDKHRWRNLYITESAVVTSDRNKKKNISSISDKYLNLFDSLNPVTYQLLDGDRTHIGFISQEVEDAMIKNGLTAEDFGGFCKDVKVNYDELTGEPVPILSKNGDCEYDYSLRYGEFIALNTAKIKQLEQKLDDAIKIINKQQSIIDSLKE